MHFLCANSNEYVTVASTIGLGAEGRVCAVADKPDVVAKLLLRPSINMRAKLVAMTKLSSTIGIIGSAYHVAWPLDILQTERGEFLGYLMPRISGAKLNIAFGHLLRLEEQSPLMSLRIAQNISLGVAHVHGLGHRIGDLGCFNIVTDAQLSHDRIGLIDCDSWLVRSGTEVFPWSGVLRNDYRAAELFGRHQVGKQLSPAQDHHSLAVLNFRLLMRGVHPFMAVARRGCARASREERITQGHWAYGGEGTRHYSPIPSSPRFAELPSDLRDLFRRAFIGGHRSPDQRPDALTWATALAQAEHDGSWRETLERRRWSPARRMYDAFAKNGRQAGIISTALAGTLCAILTATAERQVVIDKVTKTNSIAPTSNSTVSTASPPHLWRKLSQTANSVPISKGSRP